MISAFSTFAISAAAQPGAVKESDIVDAGVWSWLWILLIVAAGLGGAFYFWSKSKKGADKPDLSYVNRYQNYYSSDSYDIEGEGVDAEKELEWLRRARKSSVKIPRINVRPKAQEKGRDTFQSSSVPPPSPGSMSSASLDTKAFQDKMRKLQYAQLPINSFSQLKPSKIYDPLPLSNDRSLLNAIEQADEEFEEDESVRELAVRILTAFRTRNSVEALSQIALYDLSSNLRSKAVSTLTDFDHESVFEGILLACADPTREVRAAAARGLFRLNFDRADAWKRIIETNDEFRMSHAARAAIESGIVVKSFDRLVHEDMKVAYEAFALTVLVIKAGETVEVFDSLRNHKDERVKFALLHVLKVLKDEKSFAKLKEYRQSSQLTPDVADRVRDTIESFQTVTA